MIDSLTFLTKFLSRFDHPSHVIPQSASHATLPGASLGAMEDVEMAVLMAALGIKLSNMLGPDGGLSDAHAFHHLLCV